MSAASNCDTELPTYTKEEVGQRCSQEVCWIIIDDFVYDVTGFLEEVGFSVNHGLCLKFVNGNVQYYKRIPPVGHTPDQPL